MEIFRKLLSRLKSVNDKSSKSVLCLLGIKRTFLNMLKVDFNEVARKENLEQFLENLFSGMNSSDEECKFGLQWRTSCI